MGASPATGVCAVVFFFFPSSCRLCDTPFSSHFSFLPPLPVCLPQQPESARVAELQRELSMLEAILRGSQLENVRLVDGFKEERSRHLAVERELQRQVW